MRGESCRPGRAALLSALRDWLPLLLAIALGALLLHARDGRKAGARPVPVGGTATQLLPGADGKLEAWKISKQEVPRAALPAQVLPQPAPRRRPPDASTDSARALAAQALEAWKQGDLRQALDDFDAAVAADPDDAQVHSRYGRLLTLMTDYERAYPHLARAAELAPDDPQVWLDLETLYEKSVLLERAHDARARAEALAGGSPITRDDDGFYFLEGTRLFP
jgi:tetratricopeptide (TPR) repeat protein